MEDTTRARVAAVLGAASKRQRVTAVYDYAKRGYRNASADVQNGQVNGYDYATGSHFSGGGSGNLDFYDYDTRAHVQLRLDGTSFSGYDYHTCKHFLGTVNGGSISLYDYDSGRYHNYRA